MSCFGTESPLFWPATVKTVKTLFSKPALGGARPEAFGICEALISIYVYGIL